MYNLVVILEIRKECYEVWEGYYTAERVYLIRGVDHELPSMAVCHAGGQSR